MRFIDTRNSCTSHRALERVHPPTVYTYQPYSPIGLMPRRTSSPLKPVPVVIRFRVMKPPPGTNSIV